jgi:hypothetical protein
MIKYTPAARAASPATTPTTMPMIMPVEGPDFFSSGEGEGLGEGSTGEGDDGTKGSSAGRKNTARPG